MFPMLHINKKLYQLKPNDFSNNRAKSDWNSLPDKIIFHTGEKGSSIYIFGGQNCNNQNAIFDTISFLNVSRDGMLLDSSLSYSKMPQPRVDHCSVGYAEHFAFIIGGQTTGSIMVTKSLLFNLKSLTFVPVFFLGLSRLNPTCSIVGNKIVIAGGLTPIPGSFLWVLSHYNLHQMICIQLIINS